MLVPRKSLLIVAIAMLLTLAVATGCSPKLQDVADGSSWFHVRVPADWHARVEQTAIIMYAAKDLPETEDETFESLSVLVMASGAASDTPVPEELTDLVNRRAKSREWSDFKISKPEKLKVGGRSGYAVDVTGKDVKKRAFAGRFVLIRTNDREAMIVGLAPEERWKKESAQFDAIFEEWYWHKPVETIRPADEATKGAEGAKDEKK